MTGKNYYEKRRNTPRLPIVYTTPDVLQKLDYLAEKYGSKKAAIETAIVALYDKETSTKSRCVERLNLCMGGKNEAGRLQRYDEDSGRVAAT